MLERTILCFFFLCRYPVFSISNEPINIIYNASGPARRCPVRKIAIKSDWLHTDAAPLTGSN